VNRPAAAGLGPVLRYAAVLLLLLFFGFPLLWTALTAVKPVVLIPQSPPAWLFAPTLEHFREVLGERGVLTSLANSLVVATASTVLALLVGAPAAYAFARFRFRGKESLAFYFLSARMAPPVAVILPFFLIARDLDLLDTRMILVAAYMSFNFGFVIWLRRGTSRNRRGGAGRRLLSGQRLCAGSAAADRIRARRGRDHMLHLFLERVPVRADPDWGRRQDPARDRGRVRYRPHGAVGQPLCRGGHHLHPGGDLCAACSPPSDSGHDPGRGPLMPRPPSCGQGGCSCLRVGTRLSRMAMSNLRSGRKGSGIFQ
jgi:hypothetical protein